jgi:hypothetical protein
LSCEQGGADEAFQQFYLIAHGGLGHVQLGSSAGKAAVAGYGVKHAYGLERGEINHI